MYSSNYYQNKSDQEIKTDIEKEGFDPIKIYNKPGYIYSQHSHPETKLLAFLQGSMVVRVGEERFNCNKGDKVVIPGGLIHSAVVGANGCTFFWSEKII